MIDIAWYRVDGGSWISIFLAACCHPCSAAGAYSSDVLFRGLFHFCLPARCDLCACAWLLYLSVSDLTCDLSAVQDLRKAAIGRLAPLQQQSASTACRAWLGQLAEDMQRHCPVLMAACDTAGALAALEGHLQTAILQWQPLKLALAGTQL